MVKHKRSSWVPRLLIAVVLAYIGILILWPVAAIFQGAFSEGVGAVLDVLGRPDVQNAFWLTFELAAIALAVNGTLGTIVAWVLVRQDFRGKSF